MNRLQDCFDDDDPGEGFPGQLFQETRHDPSVSLPDFALRDFSPVLQRWTLDDPCGYVDGMNVYSAPVDHPMVAVNPLDT
jgi:RHS repeat-associated protein